MAAVFALVLFVGLLVFAGPLLNSELPYGGGGFRVDPNSFVLLLGAGFVIAIFGHLFESKIMVAAGVGLIFLATLFIPLYLSLTM